MTRDLDRYRDMKVDWNTILGEDPDILGGILRDVVKRSHKSRTKMSRRQRSEKFSQINGTTSFAEQKFSIAINALRAGDPLEKFAKRIDMPEMIVELLLDGEVVPDVDLLAEIAESLNKPYNYFLEYRIHFVLASIESFLIQHPETLSAWIGRAEL